MKTDKFSYRHDKEQRDPEFIEWWANAKAQFPSGIRLLAKRLLWEAWREGGLVADTLGRDL